MRLRFFLGEAEEEEEEEDDDVDSVSGESDGDADMDEDGLRLSGLGREGDGEVAAGWACEGDGRARRGLRRTGDNEGDVAAGMCMKSWSCRRPSKVAFLISSWSMPGCSFIVAMADETSRLTKA